MKLNVGYIVLVIKKLITASTTVSFKKISPTSSNILYKQKASHTLLLTKNMNIKNIHKDIFIWLLHPYCIICEIRSTPSCLCNNDWQIVCSNCLQLFTIPYFNCQLLFFCKKNEKIYNLILQVLHSSIRDISQKNTTISFWGMDMSYFDKHLHKKD